MKRILTDVLFGLLVIVAVFLLEFLVTLPFGSPGPSRPEEPFFVNREFLLTSIPALLVAFGFAWLRKPKGMAGACVAGSIWMAMVILFYLFIGIVNNNLGLLFGAMGIYVLFACVLAGPMVYALLKKRRKNNV